MGGYCWLIYTIWDEFGTNAQILRQILEPEIIQLSGDLN